ncbi:senecionine N-oxygenase-like [Bradysia coprophila]|uniref:senecionine N-oxygenase-like n=1 Tax=Bradysia coprophila TaxID=38358 RepID=UPI00187DD256|nr:senecionine N-oxygenase-like [Bradysia coprophila]XP_037044479.1 senecionine N-oxygenase-like [Bradysia coprophila]
MFKCCVVLIVVSLILNYCSGFVQTSIAIIGTGPSGLVTAKYAIEQGFNVTVFEQNDVIGGVWWYTDEIGKNKYGLPIHTSMYKGLRTNVPTQMMQFSDHVYGKNIVSFPYRNDIWNYLNSYALRFDVKKSTRFNHVVTTVTPIEDNKWKVVVKDLPNNKFESSIFDAVIVCNGHNFLPKIPMIEGADDFGGRKIHSHDFRNAENFVGEKVLVIGSGSSGIDLVALLSQTANHVTWSRRSDKLKFPYKNVTYKPDVKRFTKTGAEFADDTAEDFTVIFYATGFNFDYPFLGNESGITVDNNFVQPLYKNIFNIEHPTLLFIGVLSGLHPTFPTYELQAQFALKYLSGELTLPSKDEMLNDIESHMRIHMERHQNNRSSQFFALEHRDYFLELSALAKIESPPEVISTMYLDNDAMRTGDPVTFRNYRYIVLDDIRYIKKKYEN